MTTFVSERQSENGPFLLMLHPTAGSAGKGRSRTRIVGMYGQRLMVQSHAAYDAGMIVHLCAEATGNLTGEIKLVGQMPDGSYRYAIDVHQWGFRRRGAAPARGIGRRGKP